MPPDDRQFIHGEAVVDDTTLFDGDVAARVHRADAGHAGPAGQHPRNGLWRRWVAGRAAQLGSTGVAVVRDGVPAPRAARRSTFYRNVEGWLLVR